MAKCPKCNQQWQWDWCVDTYRTPLGDLCEEVDKPEGEYSMFCTCGKLLGISSGDGNGGEPYNQPEEWLDIDWELPENSFSDEEKINNE